MTNYQITIIRSINQNKYGLGSCTELCSGSWQNSITNNQLGIGTCYLFRPIRAIRN